jgi:putative DNA primase/helicase
VKNPTAGSTSGPSLRYIDTTGLPEGFDVADLIAQGVTGAGLVGWCKERVRPGIPPIGEPLKLVQTDDAPVEVPRAAKLCGPRVPPPPVPPDYQPTKSPASGAAGGARGRDVGETDYAEPERGTPPTLASTDPLVPVVEGNVIALEVAPAQSPPDADELVLPPEYSDDSLAREFTHQYAGTYLYVASWGRWLQWNGVQWLHDDVLRCTYTIRMVLRDQANDILRRAAEFGSKTRAMATKVSSASTIGNVERIARTDPKHAAASTQFDADPWLLNTPSGIVDLRTGALRPATMYDYCAKATRVGPGGECPTWLQFLQDVTAGDAELISYLQRVAGYALTGSTREHALFFFYGTGRNGKGTFLNTLEWIVGDYSRVASMDTFTESKNERHSTDLASLMGARMVTAQETDEGKRWAEARIKSMTGGDPITARFIMKDNFTFLPQFKLLISGNHRPGLRNVDEAMRARLHLIPFTITVPPEKRDPRLAEKLRAEAAGILAWMIEGAQQWNKLGLNAPLRVRKATEEYFEAQDLVQQWINDCCLRDADVRGQTLELYKSFARYCHESSEFAMQRKRWGDALELKGYKVGRNSKGQVVHGLRLRHEMDEDPFPPDDEPL